MKVDTSVTVQMEDRKKTHGSVVSFHNISYTVQVPATCCGSCKDKKEKQILLDLSGIIRPGLNAIMGPTGSGKSSLLDVLANRKNPDWLSGDVLLDGKSLPKNYQYISGYVIQNDLMIGTLTVRETLWFCANVRLPQSMSQSEKDERIKRTLEKLGLEKCADTKIGSQIIRGISGGEKKRTSIALELILEPRILFLDEPTTGLDAATASSVMTLLKKLGDQGHTIVCSIHQPRYSIYKLFDSLTLLSSGRLIYHGPNHSVLSYFNDIGYRCEEHDNPADFFLDVLIGSHGSAVEHAPISENDEAISDSAASDGKNTKKTTTELAEAYLNSDIYQSTEEELKKINDSASKVKIKGEHMYATGTFHQLKILLGRTAKNTLRNPQALLGNAVINIIIGLVFGLIYFQIDNTPVSGIQNRLGVLFFICTNLLFGSVSVLDMFVAEKEIFIHEYVSGYYRVVSYFLAKIVADLIPLRTISPIIFTSITYWMVGLKIDAAAFFTFLLIAILLGYSTVSIGLFYSSTFTPAISQLVLILTFVFTIIFSGLLINVDSVMPWLSWLQYLSVARYGLVGLSINELVGQEFKVCGNSSSAGQGSIFGALDEAVITRENNQTCLTLAGEQYLYSSLSIGSSADSITAWDLWQNPVALACITLGLCTLTYIQLLRTKIYS